MSAYVILLSVHTSSISDIFPISTGLNFVMSSKRTRTQPNFFGVVFTSDIPYTRVYGYKLLRISSQKNKQVCNSVYATSYTLARITLH